MTYVVRWGNKGNVFFGLIFAALTIGELCFTGCRVSIVDPTNPLSGNSDDLKSNSSSPLDISGNIITAGVASKIVNATSRALVINNVPAGGIHSFTIYENGSGAADLHCSSNDTQLLSTESSFIRIDVGAHSSNGKISISCTTSKGPITLELNYKADPVHILSSNVLQTADQFVEFGRGRIAQDPILGTVAVGSIRYFESNSSIIRQLAVFDQYGNAQLVSSSAAGVAGDADSDEPQVSADARYIAFRSNASNLISGVSGANGNVVYRKDMKTGQIIRVSPPKDPADIDVDAGRISISSDGRLVIFTSGNYIFRVDLGTEVAPTKVTQTVGNYFGRHIEVSSSGRYIALKSCGDLTQPLDCADGMFTQLYRLDLGLPTDPKSDYTLITKGKGEFGEIVLGDADTSYGVISPDGQKIFFESTATNLIQYNPTVDLDIDGNTPFYAGQTYALDLGAQTPAISLISSTTGSTNGFLKDGNGRYSEASGLQMAQDGSFYLFKTCVPLHNSALSSTECHLFRKNATDAPSVFGVVDTNALGQLSNSVNQLDDPSLSADSKKLFFSSDATNLVTGVTSGAVHYYIKDLTSNDISVVALGSFGRDAVRMVNDNSGFVPKFKITPDEKYAVLNIGGELINGANGIHVYRKNLLTGKLDIVDSLTAAPVNQPAKYSMMADISPNGRYVVFMSSLSYLSLVGSAPSQALSDWQTYRVDFGTSAAPTHIVTAVTQDPAGRDYAMVSNNPSYWFGQPRVANDGTVYYAQRNPNDGDLFQLMKFSNGTTTNLSQTFITPALVSQSNDTNHLNVAEYQLTPDGRYIAMTLNVTWYNPAALFQAGDVFRIDLSATLAADRVIQVNAVDAGSRSDSPMLTTDGAQMLYRSCQPMYWWQTCQVYKRNVDLAHPSQILVSSLDGITADDGGIASPDVPATLVSISGDGRFALCLSTGPNMNLNATQPYGEYYLVDLLPGAPIRARALTSIIPGTNYSLDGAQISGDGSRIIIDGTNTAGFKNMATTQVVEVLLH